MSEELRILILEDRPTDAELMLREVRRVGYEPEWKRVETESDYLAEFDQGWEIILADYTLPQFDGLRALELLKERGLDIPFIIVSGTIGEDAAVAAMKVGASDYVMKDRLARLGSAVERELHDAFERRERKRAEAALREEQARYRALFEQCPDGVLIIDAHTELPMMFNDVACRQLGYSPKEFARLRISGYEVAEKPEETKARVEKLLREGRDDFETQHRTKTGDFRNVLVTAQTIQLSGQPVFHCVFRDITERKRVEEALRASERKYRGLFESSRDAIMILEPPSWTFTSGNPASVEMFGAKNEAGFISRGPSELSPERQPDGRASAEKAKEMIETAMREGSQFFEWTHRRIGGEEFAANVLLTRVELGRNVILQATVRDITERKRLEAQFLQAQKMETVGRLAGGVAHDFNNLLTIINGTADLALTGLKEGAPLHTDLQDIRQAGERGALLTRQLLAFSRKQIMTLDVLNLSTLVADLQGMLQRLIGEHIALVVVPAKDLGSVMADPTQIEQIVMNLAVNARDAMPNGGTLTIETRNVELDEAFAAEHPSVQPGPHVMLAISDTGTGMDAATRAQIFEPFFTTKDSGKGTGLGLSTVYGIVKQSGWSIWVYSEPGKGATFKIYLPRVEGMGHKSQPAPVLTSVQGTETILVVEDEEAVRLLAKRVLQRAGYTVLTAGNGAEALLLLARHDGPVHLMLTDMVMPGMSGRDLVAQLEGINSRIKVLCTSGYTDEAILRHGLLDETAHFIGKPYNVAELTRKVREVLDS